MSEEIASGRKHACQNRRAYYDYFIEESFEAGLILTGTEVKSLRAGKASLAESHAVPMTGGIFLINFHISPYEHGNIYNVDPVRSRKLLLHKKEIEKLSGLASRKGYTIVPIAVYFKKGWAKVQIGLARGKKEHDKRDSIKEREADREMQRAIRGRSRPRGGRPTADD